MGFLLSKLLDIAGFQACQIDLTQHCFTIILLFDSGF